MSEPICCVVDCFCERPANSEPIPFDTSKPRKMPECRGCGQDVCKNCSIRTSVEGRRGRYCHDCLATIDGNDHRAMQHLKRIARSPKVSPSGADRVVVRHRKGDKV